MSTLDGNAVSTVFLDRDGTINVGPLPGEYITSPEDLVLLPSAGPAVARLNAAGLRTVLITNQRWLSQPSADFVAYRAVQSRLEQLLAMHGAWLDASYYCPHALAVCDCRKPGTGMLERAAREHRFSIRESIVIGDSETDLMAGRPIGAATILLRSEPTGLPAGLADAVAIDLMAAVDLIMKARAARDFLPKLPQVANVGTGRGPELRVPHPDHVRVLKAMLRRTGQLTADIAEVTAWITWLPS
jgi:D-glycero-D-manno-heptose 1,7-bisphosphate phosphatase